MGLETEPSASRRQSIHMISKPKYFRPGKIFVAKTSCILSLQNTCFVLQLFQNVCKICLVFVFYEQKNLEPLPRII